jgi:hypothetical protein
VLVAVQEKFAASYRAAGRDTMGMPRRAYEVYESSNGGSTPTSGCMLSANCWVFRDSLANHLRRDWRRII